MEVFPELMGLTWGTTVRPSFNTAVSRAVNGRSTRVQLQEFPTWEYTLSWEWLPNRTRGRQDLETLQSFFLLRGGNFEEFLYLAQETPIEEMILLGTGNGVEDTFQLLRTVGAFTMPAGGVADKLDLQIYVNNVLQDYADFELVDNAYVVFDTPPANTLEVRGAYQPLERVTFKESSAEFEVFMDRLWEVQQVTLISEPV